jgi:hypothetical protein
MKHAHTVFAVLFFAATASAAEIHVRPEGPLRTLSDAQREARKSKATVVVHAGTYYLPETLVFTIEDSEMEWRAADGEKVVISGGSKLELKWEPFRDGIFRARTPAGLTCDQLFVNGQRQMMARYPNFNASVRPYGGFAADAFSRERAARWSDPAGGFIHAMHRAHWGGFHYRITGKDAKGDVTFEGGWQNNRPAPMHPQHRYVENIFEELDAPGEWFHNAKAATLYYFPPAGVDLKTATVEVARLRHLVEFVADDVRRRTDSSTNAAPPPHVGDYGPVRNVTLRGFVFRHAARTFMDTKEPLLRSDWTIYRGGAVLFNGAEDCTVADCEFDQVGGNAIFVNNYNRRVTVRGCDIHDTGASAVAFVGDPKAVRNPLFDFGKRNNYKTLDKTPGPQTDNYPADCLVEDCLLRHFGVVEKQATGVELSMAMGVTVRHCSIYEGSRAGINISEGTFGGHVIEFCDVFDTVLETGDHGSFNSWGRDRFWGLLEAPAAELPQLALLDVVKPNVLRNNRWRCDHGWDVDLDDGSTNFEIYNNLFLHGGLKLREGFHRKVWNNITANNSLHPHVWYENSADEVTRNIWMGAYRPAVMKVAKWGKEVDRNLFTTTDADRTKFAANGCDANSLVGDAMFMDPAKGDYRVKDGSPALKLGFKNFPMDQFGVTSPRLKAIARTPELPSQKSTQTSANGNSRAPQRVEHFWLQAKVRDIEGDEFSAFSVSKDSGGVQLLEVPAGSAAARSGFQANDLIQGINSTPVKTFAELMRRQNPSSEALNVRIVRAQQTRDLRVESFPIVTIEAALAPASAVTPIREISARPSTRNDPLPTLRDNSLGTGYGPIFSNGTRGGIYRADLGSVKRVVSVATWSHNHGGKRGAQNFTLFGSAAADPGWDLNSRTTFTPIAEVDTRGTQIGKHHGTLIRNSSGQPLGAFRWLVWIVQPVTDSIENTSFQEFQIKAE